MAAGHRVTSKMRLRQQFKKHRQFVEGFFGRGSAFAKLTYNQATLMKAIQKNAGRGVKLPDGIEADLAKAGATMVHGLKNSKSLLYLDKRTVNDMPEASVHELAHVGYIRNRKRNGKRVMKLVTEILSCTMQLEWLVKENRMTNYNPWMKYGEKCSKESAFVDTSPAKDPVSEARNNSSNGLALAYTIFTKYPNLKSDAPIRERLIRDLMTQEFTNPVQALQWVENYR